MKRESNTALRMYIALRMLRAWSNNGTAGYSLDIILSINKWIDEGMKGPIPWPDSPFFEQWAKENGMSNVYGSVGYTFPAKIETETGSSSVFIKARAESK